MARSRRIQACRTVPRAPRILERSESLTMRAEFRTDHVAFMTWDTGATHDFYTRVMGWPLAVAWGRAEATPPFFQVGYDASSFIIEFEEQVGAPRVSQSPSAGFPHFGLAAADVDDLKAWIGHLDECGVEYLCFGDDDVFFTDPNGVSFQVFVPTDHGTPDERLAKSEQNLAAWLSR